MNEERVGSRPAELDSAPGGVKVTFLPDGKSVRVPAGTKILDAAAAAGVFIDAPCGDRGVCGKCRVRTEGSIADLTAAEAKYLSRQRSEQGWRLACQARVEGDAIIQVPRSAMQIAVAGEGDEVALEPNVQKAYLHLQAPTMEDARPYLTRLEAGLQEAGLDGADFDLEVLRALPRVLGTGDGLTAALVGRECIGLEPGDTRAQTYGVAFDIGTTTVVGSLVDLTTGREVAVAAGLNEQMLYGADVISRINLVINDPEGLEKLHRQILRVLNNLLDDLLRQSQVPRERIYEVTVVGNTCMHHLAMGVNPSSLALAPFTSVVPRPVAIAAGDLGLGVHPRALVYYLPVVAGHVGADTVGVILATGLHHSDRIRMAIDIGTNGEIMLGSRERLLACSTAAGPAFEGTQIRQGMRATVGAIERVYVGEDVEISVIGGPTQEAHGICGSGLIDAVAELLAAGVIDPSGRLRSREDLDGRASPALLDRCLEIDDGRAFRLSPAGAPLVALTQRDVRELQLAKGAIFAGIQILKRSLGVSDEDVEEIYLAGAFGSFIRPESAQAIGLIPNLPLDRVRAVGNAARIGARMALISLEARRQAERIGRHTEHVELFHSEAFQDEFMASMRFPV